MADPAALVERLHAHLDQVYNSPSTPLDLRLLDECEYYLPSRIAPEVSQSLVLHFSQLLSSLQQDPSPAIRVLLKLLEPFPFSAILALEPPVDFVAGLNVQAQPFNLLMLSLLEKATLCASDAAILAGMPEVVFALVNLWLCTEDTGVAEKASAILLGLLKVDHQDSKDAIGASGQGVMWRRLFGDRNIYDLMFSICDFRTQPAGQQLSKRQKSLAQARLLEWIPKAGAIDLDMLAISHNADVETAHRLKRGSRGLVEFAAVHMVDYDSRSLDPLGFLMEKGLHQRTAAFYLDPDNDRHSSLDISFLYGPAAHYLATYASLYPSTLARTNDLDGIQSRLRTVLHLSRSRGARAESPKHDLHVLSMLPRFYLVPGQQGVPDWSASPLSLITSSPTFADALNTLATVFHGPLTRSIDFPATADPAIKSNDQRDEAEKSAARALYLHYVAHNSALWSDVVRHAETVALKELALPAIGLITAVATANWSDAGDEEALRASLRVTTPLPRTGLQALLTPPALPHVLPYLLRPAQTFSNLVGGRGDAESAAYRIAVAKFDALLALGRRVEEAGDEVPAQIAAAVRERIREGAWGAREEVGGRIATLEM
ncbi:hypothetical protein H2201_001781 [Coniosporium apollinis]|uniref:DNA mismatch repair protein HSM3 N-terminal domain-containing protein n=1 Tax=Coniosporium apollinis TaxID=61459 RepID=A0ABQ9P1X0_9PEZI|nr:hypothetical protein H2201_001781 [Coniosporium apollinis]